MASAAAAAEGTKSHFINKDSVITDY